MFVQYLEDYAKHFDLRIISNCEVQKVRMENEAPFPTWVVDSTCGLWRCQAVVIATGHYGKPYMPQWPGMEDFTGSLMHSVQYKTGRDYAGKRVLVIGAGNSGAEIATDLAEQGASFVGCSIRTPPPVVPRDWLGLPVQLYSIILTLLPPRLADRIGHFLAHLAMGDLTRYGLKPPGWLPFTAHRLPIVDVGFVKELKRGGIHVRPNINRFTENGVVYEDGREEAFDVVVAATGFKTGLQELLDVPGVVDERGYPKYPSGRPTTYPGFYFMGYNESVRGHLFEANRDSRRLAKIIATHLRKVTLCETPSPIKAS
jgi:putative flavoprotein involved in K+ transport